MSHLKTSYGGQLLVAVGRDPNDQYFSLAFAVVENECKETLRWFQSLLLEDIGDIQSNRWVFISDQQKVNLIISSFNFVVSYIVIEMITILLYCLQGLMTIFDEILEGVKHRFCLRHLYNNYELKFGGGVVEN